MADILVHCQCGQRLRAKPELAGRRLSCPKCKQPIAVPAPVPDLDGLDNSSAPADDGFWDEMPKTPTLVNPDTNIDAHKTSIANDVMARAHERRAFEKGIENTICNGQIVSGIGMVALAIPWLGILLLAGRISIYPIFLLITGSVALINGIAQKLRRRGSD
ncbi:MAG TPA: hypothetical protein VGI40_13645 [Pirellulaceae bacterium]|jgi:hypothetical protein